MRPSIRVRRASGGSSAKQIRDMHLWATSFLLCDHCLCFRFADICLKTGDDEDGVDDNCSFKFGTSISKFQRGPPR